MIVEDTNVASATYRALRLESDDSFKPENHSPIKWPVLVCGLDANGRLFFELTSSHDIGPAECCIHIRTRPQQNSPLAIRISQLVGLEEENTQVLFQAVWLRSEGEGWVIGAESIK